MGTSTYAWTRYFPMGWGCGPGHRAGMPNYRRQRVAGGRYFFTVALQDRSSSLLIDRITDLGQAFRLVRSTLPFKIDALVILPEHLHCLWTLPDNDTDFSTRWSSIKSAFTRKIENGEPRSISRRSKRERGIWQRRFWEHAIRDDEDLRLHLNYIHFNPVKHGYADDPADWPHSTFHRWKQQTSSDTA